MRTLDELIKHGVQGRRVLVRSDLNVPIKDGKVTDDGRVRASLPVLTKLLDHGARVIVAAHLGRPKGAPDPQYSLGPVADRGPGQCPGQLRSGHRPGDRCGVPRGRRFDGRSFAG